MSSKRVSVPRSPSPDAEMLKTEEQRTTAASLSYFLRDLTRQVYKPTTDALMAKRLRVRYHNLGQIIGSLMPVKLQCRCLSGKCRGPVVDSSSDEDNAEEASQSRAYLRDTSGDRAEQQGSSAGCAQQDAQALLSEADVDQPPAKKQRADPSPAAAQASKRRKAAPGAAVPIAADKTDSHEGSDQEVQDMQDYKAAGAQTSDNKAPAAAAKQLRVGEQRIHIRRQLQSLQARCQTGASLSQPSGTLGDFDTAAETSLVRELCTRSPDAKPPSLADSEKQVTARVGWLSERSRRSLPSRFNTGFYLLSMQQQGLQKKQRLPRGARSPFPGGFHVYMARLHPGLNKEFILQHIKWYTMCRLWPELVYVQANSWKEVTEWMRGNMLKQEIHAMMARQTAENKAQENSQRAADTAAAHMHTAQQRMQARAMTPTSMYGNLFGDEEEEASEIKANSEYSLPGPLTTDGEMRVRSPSPLASSPTAAASTAAASDARLAAEEVEPMDESADDHPATGMDAGAMASAAATDANAALEDEDAQANNAEAEKGGKESEEGEKKSNETQEVKQDSDAAEKDDMVGEQESSSHEDDTSSEEDDAAAGEQSSGHMDADTSDSDDDRGGAAESDCKAASSAASSSNTGGAASEADDNAAALPTAAAHGGKEQQPTNMKRKRGC